MKLTGIRLPIQIHSTQGRVVEEEGKTFNFPVLIALELQIKWIYLLDFNIEQCNWQQKLSFFPHCIPFSSEKEKMCCFPDVPGFEREKEAFGIEYSA
jgi:hypothetical protein